MNPLDVLLARLFEPTAPAIETFLLKATALFALAWLAHWALCAAHPRWRCHLWRATACGQVVLALFAVTGAGWSVPVTVTSSEVTTPAVMETPTAAEEIPSGALVDAQAESAAEEPALFSENASPVPAAHESTQPAALPAALPPKVESGSPVGLLALIWLVGAAVGFLQDLRARIALQRLLRDARDIDDPTATLARQIGSRLRIRRSFGIRVAPAVATPVLVGHGGPTLLFPPDFENRDERTRAAVLAHELSHIAYRDLGWNRILGILARLLWFHPLAWRIRSAHTAACELTADAVSAEILGEPGHYRAILARIALEVDGRARHPGMAMARKADVRKRLERLPHTLRKMKVSRRALAGALFLGLPTVLALGALQLERMESRESENDGTQSPAAVAAQLGDDLQVDNHEEVLRIFWDVVYGWKEWNSEEMAAFLNATLPVVKNLSPERAQAFMEHAQAHGREFGRCHLEANSGAFLLFVESLQQRAKGQEEIPADSLAEAFRGFGFLPDEDPEALPPARRQLRETLIERFTAAGGSLEDLAPTASTRPLDIRGHAVNEKHSNALDLENGKTVAGTVVDSDGNPLAGVLVMLKWFDSYSPTRITGPDGTFRFENADTGVQYLTAGSEDWPPAFLKFDLEEDRKDIVLRMEPPQTVRIRVVDPEGNPVRAYISPKGPEWTFQIFGFGGATNPKGEWTWENAPSEPVLCTIGSLGFMEKRLEIAPSEEPVEIVVQPDLHIVATVVDAESGEPVPQFRFQTGTLRRPGSVSWDEEEVFPGSAGSFRHRFDRETEYGYRIRVTADGYLPEESRDLIGGGEQKLRFALRKGAKIEGVAYRADGSPAQGATVYLATEEHGIDFKDNRVHYFNGESRTLGTDGRYSFNPVDERYILVVADDSGAGTLTRAEREAGGELRLEPWGSLEILPSPRGLAASPQTVWLGYAPLILNTHGSHVETKWYYSKTEISQSGPTTLPKLKPGNYQLAIDEGPHRTSGSAVAIKAATRTSHPIQPGHATVRGRFDLSAIKAPILEESHGFTPVHLISGPPELYQMEESVRDEANFQFWHSPDGLAALQHNARRHEFVCDNSGAFSADGVKPGRYQMRAHFRKPGSPPSHTEESILGGALVHFTVPEPEADEDTLTLDLGTIRVFPKRPQPVAVGDPLPDMEFHTADGTKYRLSDFRGRPLILGTNSRWYSQSGLEGILPGNSAHTIIQFRDFDWGPQPGSPNQPSAPENRFYNAYSDPRCMELNYTLGLQRHKALLVDKTGTIRQIANSIEELFPAPSTSNP